MAIHELTKESAATERPTDDLNEVVASVCWGATYHDRECIRVKKAIFEAIGLHEKKSETWPLSWHTRLDLEPLIGTEFAKAVASLAAAITPTVRQRVTALGDLLPIADDMAIDQMPEPAYLTFLQGVFTEAGIADRFQP